MSNIKHGNGLWPQIDESNKREYVTFTGEGGIKIFNRKMKEFAYISHLNSLETSVPKEEHIRLTEMFNSPDEESFNLSCMIMDELLIKTN